MTRDPIIEELYRTREAILKRFGDDLRAVCADAARRQGADGRTVMRRPSRPPRKRSKR